MAHMNVLKHSMTDIQRGLEDATETLKWCRKHLQERKASEALRLVQLNLGHLALALDWQMEGESDKARASVDHVWWQAHREDYEIYDSSMLGH